MPEFRGDRLYEQRRRAYAALRAEREDLFANPPGGAYTIEFGPAEQEAVAEKQHQRMRDLGLPPEYGDVGVLYQDDYLLLVRDAVRFPDGRLDSYIRIMPAQRSSGSVVLPLADRGVFLVHHFRHATRTWSWEVPRGFAGPGEDPARTASRELAEETGLVAAELVHLGTVQQDAGISSAAAEIFAARVAGEAVPDRFEAIDEIRLLSPAELDDWIAGGRIQDALTLAACALARSRNLLGAR